MTTPGLVFQTSDGNRPADWVLVIPLFLSLAVAGGSFWVSGFAPRPVSGVDPMATERLGAIAFGLGAPLLVGLFALPYRPHCRDHFAPLALLAACVLVCLAFGWRNYPYWANGVYQADLGNFESIDFDPKALPPMTWIGELWRLPVFCFPLLVGASWVVLGPVVAIAWNRPKDRCLCVTVFLLLTLAMVPLFWRVHLFTDWLLD